MMDSTKRQRPAGELPSSAPSRALLAATARIAARTRTDRAVTAAELADLLGELEPLTIEKLIATRATIDEVAEAVSAIEDEDTFGELHHEPSSPRQAEVRAILEELVFEDVEEGESEREIARV